MERQLQAVGARIGTKKPVTSADLIDNRSLTQHAYLPIIEEKSTSKRWYHWGSGVENADTGVGRLGMDLQVADDDAGTNAAAAVGKGRFAVYSDDPEETSPKATGDVFTFEELRSLEALDHRDKELFPVLKPGASQDEYLVFEAKIDPSQEGKVVYAEGSSVTATKSEVRVN